MKTKHHRKPTSIGGQDEVSNISYVPLNKHQAWHTLFGNHTAEKIASIINQLWLDPDYKFFVRRKRNKKNISRIPLSKMKWQTTS